MLTEKFQQSLTRMLEYTDANERLDYIEKQAHHMHRSTLKQYVYPVKNNTAYCLKPEETQFLAQIEDYSPFYSLFKFHLFDKWWLGRTDRYNLYAIQMLQMDSKNDIATVIPYALQGNVVYEIAVNIPQIQQVSKLIHYWQGLEWVSVSQQDITVKETYVTVAHEYNEQRNFTKYPRDKFPNDNNYQVWLPLTKYSKEPIVVLSHKKMVIITPMYR